MDSLRSLFGGGSAQAASYSPASSDPTGGGLGGFSSVSDMFSNLANNAFDQADPTGSIGASETISPPNAGPADVQASSVGGTQSDPGNQGQGGSPNQPPQGQSGQKQTYAPDSAVNQLKDALKKLAAQKQLPNQNPWVPQPAQATQVTPQGGPAAQALPGLMAGETGAQSPTLAPGFAGSQPGGAADIPTSAAESGSMPLPSLATGQTGKRSPQVQPGDLPADTANDALTAGGPGRSPTGPAGVAIEPPNARVVGDPAEPRTPPAPPPSATPTGPAAPGTERGVTVHKGSTVGGKPTPKTDDQGNKITVLPTKTPLPTHKPGPVQPQPGPIMRDVTGGQSVPTALPQLAQMALAMLPLLAMAGAMGGFGGGRGRHGGRGGRFPHIGGFHHGGRGHWPYFHPGQGWQFHAHHPGGGWMPMNPRHMHHILEGDSGGQQDPSMLAASILQSVYGGGNQGQANQQRPGGGGYPPGMNQGGGDGAPGGTGAGYVKSGNDFTDALTSIESPGGNVVSQSDKDSRGLTAAQGGDQTEISQGYFQIQSYHNGGTWQTYAPQAGLNLNDYPNPMRASYDQQHAVARLIPFHEWGGDTKRLMHARFKSFPDSWTLGQLEDHFGQGAVASTIQKPEGPPTWQPGGNPGAWTGTYSPTPLG